MNRFSVLSLMGLSLLFLLCAGCGPGNTVRLIHRPLDSSLLPPPGAASVAVVEFKDMRKNKQLGVRRDGSAFIANASVPEWLSRALGDELGRQGYQVSYATAADQARRANPDFIVTGVITETWLREASSTELAATLRATLTLSSRKGKVLTENLSASQTRKSLPSSSVAEELLLDTLQELVRPAAIKVQHAINARK